MSSCEKAVFESVLGPVSRQEKEETGGREEGRELQLCKGPRVDKGGLAKGEGILRSSPSHRAVGQCVQ